MAESAPSTIVEPPQTKTAEVPRSTVEPKAPTPRCDKLPPFKVLLHNDDHTPMDLVVRIIRELTPLNTGQAFMAMMSAHTRGVSLLLVTHKERAELYREQFASKGLKVTIEPA